jgi:hypothetical protein
MFYGNFCCHDPISSIPATKIHLLHSFWDGIVHCLITLLILISEHHDPLDIPSIPIMLNPGTPHPTTIKVKDDISTP